MSSKDTDLLPDTNTKESGRFTTTQNLDRPAASRPPFKFPALLASPLGMATTEEVLNEYRGNLAQAPRRKS